MALREALRTSFSGSSRAAWRRAGMASRASRLPRLHRGLFANVVLAVVLEGVDQDRGDARHVVLFSSLAAFSRALSLPCNRMRAYSAALPLRTTTVLAGALAAPARQPGPAGRRGRFSEPAAGRPGRTPGRVPAPGRGAVAGSAGSGGFPLPDRWPGSARELPRPPRRRRRSARQLAPGPGLRYIHSRRRRR